MLAAYGAAAGAAIGILVWAGASRAAGEYVAVPALLLGFLTGYLARVAGRGEGWRHACLAGLVAALGCLAGHVAAIGIIALAEYDDASTYSFSRALTILTSIAGQKLSSLSPANFLWDLLAVVLAASLAGIGRRGARALAALRWLDQLRLLGGSSPAPTSNTALCVRGRFPAVGPAGRRVALGTAIAFLLISSCLMYWARDEGSGWILMTFPGRYEHSGNPVVGSTTFWGTGPVMTENTSTAWQVAWFNGGRPVPPSFRYLRGMYPFSSSLLTPFLGLIGSMLAVNWLSWAACAAAAWWLTLRLFEDIWAASLAALLVSGSIAAIVHVGDYSPHLMAFAVYFVGACLLYETGVGHEARPWSTHRLLGVYMALACLTYNSGVMLVLAYIVVAWRHNRWMHMAGAVLLALTARPLWRCALLALGISVEDVEAVYLRNALLGWYEIWQQPALAAAADTLRLASECVFFVDSPLVLLLGIISFWFVPRAAEQRRLGWALILPPFLAALLFAPYATARGYVAYPAMIWFFSCLAGAAVMTLRRYSARPSIAAVLLGCFLAMHFAWSTAHFHFWLGPIKSYFLGWDWGAPYLLHAPTRVMSLTGAEPIPALFGGRHSIFQAGAALFAEPMQELAVSWVWAAATRFLYFAYLSLAAWYLYPLVRRRMVVTCVLLVLLVGTSLFSGWTFRSAPKYLDVDCAIALPPGAGIRYRIEVARPFIATLQQQFETESELLLFVDASPDTQLNVSAGSHKVRLRALGDFMYRIDNPAAFLAALARAGELTVEAVNGTEREICLGGWQRRDLAGRTLQRLEGPPSQSPAPARLPAVELRLATDGHLQVIGF